MGEIQAIKVAGTAGTSTDGVASIDIPEDGHIVAINSTIKSDDATLGERANMEISFLATNQIVVNDARGTIFNQSAIAQGGTGVIGYAENVTLQLGDGIPVQGGERIHLHIQQSAAHSTNVDCTLYVELGRGIRRKTRRR